MKENNIKSLNRSIYRCIYMINIFFENNKNSNYQTPSYVNNNFGYWLVGYDGGVKLFSKDASILKNIFSTIDSMPMRKDEMSSRNSPCS